ncbi:hypothetical protein D1007_27511 [Hordeum vulgare]|nr:hypothetical protein D1007_27511 [Hordeum vulgare]
MERYAPTLPVIVPRSPCTTTITMRGGRRRSRLGMTTTARGRCQRERPHMWMSTNHRGKVRVRDGVNVRNIVNNQRQRGRCVDENIIPVFFTLKPSPMHHTQHTACIQEVRDWQAAEATSDKLLAGSCRCKQRGGWIYPQSWMATMDATRCGA